MIRWVRETADVEFPTARGPGNEAELLRTLIREARSFREHRAVRAEINRGTPR